MRKGPAIAYIAIVMCVLAVPFVCMPFAPYNADAELQKLSEFPELEVDGEPNLQFLSEAGIWFDDHFAFRQQLMQANSDLQATVFGESTTKQVVVGSDGWLYYGGTLSDYQRKGEMTDRAVDNAAYNLALAKEYVESKGAKFAVAIAPNKNSIEPEHMPFYLIEGEGQTNLDALSAKLDEYDVEYVDLYDMFSNANQTLYMKTDTHWTAEGARLAYCEIMDALGKRYPTFADSSVSQDAGFVGDLEQMLHPLRPSAEPADVVDDAQDFSYTNGASATSDSFILTKSKAVGANGSLVMFRDSFGNSLLPFFATAFSNACFTKMIPYDLTDVETQKADCVIVERAERHVDFFATDPPIFPAFEREARTVTHSEQNGATVQAQQNGPYIQVQGIVDEQFVDAGSKIFVVVSDSTGAEKWFEASHQTTEASADGSEPQNDYGYIAYLNESVLPSGALKAKIVVTEEAAATQVASAGIRGDR